MTRIDSEAGFSLVETVFAIFLFGVISTGFYQVMITQSRSADTTRSVSRISDEARLGLNRMVRDIREADVISDASSTSVTVRVNYNGDGLYTSDEILTYTYDPAADTVTLNGETLMTGVDQVGPPGAKEPVFDYGSNNLYWDWNGDGVTTWQEVDAASSDTNGVTGVGDHLGTLNAAEFPYLTNVTITMRPTDGSRGTDFYQVVQMRNRV